MTKMVFTPKIYVGRLFQKRRITKWWNSFPHEGETIIYGEIETYAHPPEDYEGNARLAGEGLGLVDMTSDAALQRAIATVNCHTILTGWRLMVPHMVCNQETSANFKFPEGIFLPEQEKEWLQRVQAHIALTNNYWDEDVGARVRRANRMREAYYPSGYYCGINILK